MLWDKKFLDTSFVMGMWVDVQTEMHPSCGPAL
jgi:hypothetical protein